jgi:hypothetical protein
MPISRASPTGLPPKEEPTVPTETSRSTRRRRRRRRAASSEVARQCEKETASAAVLVSRFG